MKKGIVLEVHDEHVTILTPEGEFLKSRKQKGQVDLGEEIVFFPLHRAEKERKGKLSSIFRAKWAVISVLTAIILAFSLYPKYTSNQVYAYVSVDVNPSVELGVNKDMKVISIEAYNEEGKDIIKQLVEWENKDLTKVSSQMFDIFREKGYLTENSEVLIASVLTHEKNEGWNSLMQSKITSISEKIQQDKVSITTLETTTQERSDAIKEGLSPGKYIQKEQKTDLVDSEDTSQTEIVPSIPMNHKPHNIKQVNSKENFADELQVEKNMSKEAKELKELKEVRKEERKEHKEHRKQEQKEIREQQKQEHKELKEHQKQEKKEQHNQQKQEKQDTVKQQRNEPQKGHHAKDKKNDARGDSNGKNKRDEKKNENKRGNN
ncbi:MULTISPECIES: anti-sigma factor domain-containing protein [unclassified Sutcliffiella]|uniref:anti-sigma factor domain-containing protein n=1 Tax=unclassified Sutcliffiella TaxID=2837532 RepID=UPI0030CD2FC8